ncbi:hypothetical protein LZ30DRAFT_734291, partial [Colletotrichum cereale]
SSLRRHALCSGVSCLSILCVPCVRCPFLALKWGILYMNKSYVCGDNRSCDDSGFLPAWKDPSRTLNKKKECCRRDGCVVSVGLEIPYISLYS